MPAPLVTPATDARAHNTANKYVHSVSGFIMLKCTFAGTVYDVIVTYTGT